MRDVQSWRLVLNHISEDGLTGQDIMNQIRVGRLINEWALFEVVLVIYLMQLDNSKEYVEAFINHMWGNNSPTYG